MLSVLKNLDQSVETPALVLDEAAMQRNIAKMAKSAVEAGVSLRPHAKTHKCLEVARAQMAGGAIGISCATVAELSEFASAGFDELLLTSPVADPLKLQRLAEIFRSSRIGVVVDHVEQVKALNALVTASSIKPRVLIDIDVGQRRTGVCGVAAALEIATQIAGSSGLEFAGIQGFAGHVQHIADPIERLQSSQGVARSLAAYADALQSAGHMIQIVTGSGTGASEFDLDGPYTELQVGSYVFMDADYGAIRRAGGLALPFDPSLFVLATVTSVNRPNEFTIDAGVKALAFNGPPPSRIIGAPEGSTYRFAGDEHGIITMPEDRQAPVLGSRVLVMTTHCDPTVNLHPRYTVIKSDGSVDVWPIVGRYAF